MMKAERQPGARLFMTLMFWYTVSILTRQTSRLRKSCRTSIRYSLIFEDNSAAGAGRPRDVYKISFNQFEELMISAQTPEGKRARKLVLLLKKILQDYIVAEQVHQARAAEAARANALQQQLDGLRAQQQHLYCFRLFGNRVKIGIAKDVDRRIRQHNTSCPSGYLVYSVPISCKAMEKLFENQHEAARCLDQDGGV